MATDAPFAVFDIEALNWNEYRTGCFMTSDGADIRCDTAAQLSAVVEAFPGRAFAHFGGRYDFFFLNEPKTVALSGSGILRAQLGRASLYDSWFLFQMSLAKLGKAVGHAKFEGKSDAIETLTDDETYAHCRNDCDVLRRALLKHREWCLNRPHDAPRWPATAGGTAVYCLESYEVDGVAHLRKEQVELGDWFRQYAAVTGGRVELWQTGIVAGPVYSYDIRSSYPRSWIDGPIPLGPWRRVTKLAGPGVYRATVKQSRETFPVVAPFHRWQYDGEAWVTHEEIGAVTRHGGQVEIHEGYASHSDPQDFGAHFAVEMYAAKQQGDPWAKVSINSAHGKFGQGVIQQNWVKRQGVWAADLELGFPAWHQRPLISAFVLSRARIRLHAMLHELQRRGWRVFYVDTDCVHTDCPPDQFPGTLGAALGEWAHEATATEAVYVAPKVYMLKLDDGGVKMAAKGLPRDAVTWEHMVSAAQGIPIRFSSDKGLIGFRRLDGTWEPRRAFSARRLSPQTGGKQYVKGRSGKLQYVDAARRR